MNNLLKLWLEFKKAQDEYLKDPERKKGFSPREDFEAFIHWVEYRYFL